MLAWPGLSAPGQAMDAATLKLDNARFVVTVDPERRVIQSGSVLVQGQRITHVGKAADLATVPAERLTWPRSRLSGLSTRPAAW